MKKILLFIALLIVFTIVFTQTNKYIVDPKGCIGCTICVQKCPVKAIEMKDNKAVIDVNKCIGCGLCASNCPVKAISVIKPAEKKTEAGDSAPKEIPDSIKTESKQKLSDPATAQKDSTRKADPDSLKKEVNPKVKEADKKDGVLLKDIKRTEVPAIAEKKNEIKPPQTAQRTIYKVDEEGCIGCKICISKCPVDVIEYRKNSAVIDPKKCIGCGLCAVSCPVKTIAKVEIRGPA